MAEITSARQLAGLGPLEQLRAGRLGRRLSQLLLGLYLYGLTIALLIRSTLGNMPWDVLHQGLATQLPASIGTWIVVMSGIVLLLWIPLREIPGLGTLANALLVGVFTDLNLSWIERPDNLAVRIAVVALAIAGNGLATALYIGAQLGSGPRDGLMTGLHRRTGISLQVVRTSLEVTVVVTGFLLGGTLGFATVAYALVIGPLVQRMLPPFIVQLRRPSESPSPTDV